MTKYRALCLEDTYCGHFGVMTGLLVRRGEVLTLSSNDLYFIPEHSHLMDKAQFYVAGSLNTNFAVEPI